MSLHHYTAAQRKQALSLEQNLAALRAEVWERGGANNETPLA